MKKSHKWKVTCEARCPRCGWWVRYQLSPKEGLKLKCWHCDIPFELGKQR